MKFVICLNKKGENIYQKKSVLLSAKVFENNINLYQEIMGLQMQ